jgi:membrane-associated phospholipid phosphatase
MQTVRKPCRLSECAAWLLSLVFHPVFIPFYAVLVFLSVSHYFFYDTDKIIRLIFLSAVVVPLLIQFLLYRLNILRSFFLIRPTARLGFTLLMALIYFLLYTTLKPVAVLEYIAIFFRGIVFSLLLSAAFNLFKIKPGLHTMALAGTLFFFLYWSYDFRTNILDIISVIIAVTTLVTAARLKLRAHTLSELIIGLIIGITGQAVSFFLF